MLLRINAILLNNTYFFFFFVNFFGNWLIFSFLGSNLSVIACLCNFFFWSFIEIEGFGNEADSLVGDLMIVSKPIEVICGY